MLGELTPLEETRAYKELVAIGAAQGRKKGRQEEAAVLVLRQLARRFGPLPAPLQGQIGGLEVDALEVLGEALLDFVSVADLEMWLGQPGKDRPH